MSYKKKSFSVIIPVYNEEAVIEKVVQNIQYEMDKIKSENEIIIVNDGSSDKCRRILESLLGVKVIHHPYSKGYGAALKTGVKNAKFDWLLFIDGDGQHKPKYIAEFVEYIPNYDMVVGTRQGYKGPCIRQPGKKVLNWLANYLVDFKIPDLNSGFRVVKRDLFNKFIHLYPNGFSLSTTITLAFLKAGLNVKYVPITIEKRTGKSTVRSRHALEVLFLITRMIVLFSPMRFFMPLAMLLFLFSVVSIVYDISQRNLTDVSVVLFVSTILVFFLGVILDQVSAIRRESKNNVLKR